MIETGKDFLKITVDNDYLLKGYLLKKNISSRFIARSFYNSNVFVNNKLARRGTKVKKGDEIKIIYDKEKDVIEAECEEIEILYEDMDLLIVNKPAGLVCHPTKFHQNNTLGNRVRYYFDSIGIERKVRFVNRLDKDTSGIVILAKNPYIDGEMSRMIKEKKIDRRYLLEVNGFLECKSGIINKPIYKEEGKMKRFIDSRGKESLTIYKVLEELESTSIIEAKLETGRSHQIRVHFASIGNPIIGDEIYGNEDLKNQLRLKSYFLSFIHPVSYNRIQIQI